MGEKRILILLPSHQIFGQEQALITIAQKLQSDEMAFEFLLHRKWGVQIGQKLTTMGFSWTALSFGTIWSLSLTRRDYLLPIKNFLAIFLVTLEALTLVRKRSFTHIILGNATFSFYLLPFLYFVKNKTKIIYRHGDELAEHTSFHRLLNRLLMKTVDLNVANCKFLANNLERRRPAVSAQIIYNLPHKIIDKRLISAVQQLKTSNYYCKLLFVGQISESKGADLLFLAFCEIIKLYPDTKLMVVGEVPGVGAARSIKMDSAVNKMMKNYPKNIEFFGYQSNVINYYLEADILICPSVYNEPSANVILEAKCLGIPSIVFNVGGMPELVEHGVDGYICPAISCEELKIAIESYLSDPQKLAYEKSMALSTFNNKFGVKRYISEWFDVLSV